MYQAKPITSDELAEFYRLFNGDKTFLQSAHFAAYRKACGETIRLEGYYVQDQLVAVALMQQLSTKLKRWLHVPHGPLAMTGHNTPEFWTWWLNHYQQLGRELKLDLVRVSPLLNLYSPPCEGERAGVANTLQQDESLIFQKQGFKPAAIHLVNPEISWVLDITPGQDDLLQQMKKSTRYEVRRGLKPETGFSVTVDHDLDTFWQLHEATVARQGFVPFTRQSTEAELEAFGDDCAIITVWHEGQALASGVFLFDDRAGYYHQGASVHSKLPAAHAYLWAAICEAKKRGCTEFNFWGVCGEDQTKHPWFGLSKFKRGFGGFERAYLHVHDCELTWKAKLNRGLETWRKKKRGY